MSCSVAATSITPITTNTFTNNGPYHHKNSGNVVVVTAKVVEDNVPSDHLPKSNLSSSPSSDGFLFKVPKGVPVALKQAKIWRSKLNLIKKDNTFSSSTFQSTTSKNSTINSNNSKYILKPKAKPEPSTLNKPKIKLKSKSKRDFTRARQQASRLSVGKNDNHKSSDFNNNDHAYHRHPLHNDDHDDDDDDDEDDLLADVEVSSNHNLQNGGQQNEKVVLDYHFYSQVLSTVNAEHDYLLSQRLELPPSLKPPNSQTFPKPKSSNHHHNGSQQSSTYHHHLLQNHQNPQHLQQNPYHQYLQQKNSPHYKSRRSQLQQKLAHQLEESRFRCGRCPFSAPTPQMVANHRASHHHRRNQQCGVCSCIVPEEVFEDHLKLVHRTERNFPCNKCFATFVKISRLLVHLKEHKRPKPKVKLVSSSNKLKSYSEDFKTAQIGSQVLEMFKNGKNTLAPNQNPQTSGQKIVVTNGRKSNLGESYCSYICDLCNTQKTFPSRYLLDEHKREVHFYFSKQNFSQFEDQNESNKPELFSPLSLAQLSQASLNLKLSQPATSSSIITKPTLSPRSGSETESDPEYADHDNDNDYLDNYSSNDDEIFKQFRFSLNNGGNLGKLQEIKCDQPKEDIQRPQWILPSSTGTGVYLHQPQPNFNSHQVLTESYQQKISSSYVVPILTTSSYFTPIITSSPSSSSSSSSSSPPNTTSTSDEDTMMVASILLDMATRKSGHQNFGQQRLTTNTAN